MNAQHTPGPWEIDRSGKYYKPCIRKNGVVIAILPDNGLSMGETDAKWFREQDAVNARLIAAAPELLEACRFSLCYLEDYAETFDRECPDEGVLRAQAKFDSGLQALKSAIVYAQGVPNDPEAPATPVR